MTQAAEPNSLFLTGSGTNTTATKRGGKRTIRYKEQVVKALVHIGIPETISDLAVIDLKHMVTVGYHEKHDPIITARNMANEVARRYKNEDGSWHYLR